MEVSLMKVKGHSFLSHLGSREKSRLGFSLVEVVIAMAILTIGILGLLPMLAFNVKSNQYSKCQTYANFLADQAIEAVRAWPVYETTAVSGGITLGITDFTNPNLYYLEQPAPSLDPHHEYRVSVEGYRNGYSLGDCGGGAMFGQTASDRGHPNVDEGNLQTWGAHVPDGSINEAIQGDCTGSAYRGEDFVVVSVTVIWTDTLSVSHTNPLANKNTFRINRQAYIAKF